MKDVLVIAYGAGLQDGLNPCIFMTSAIFIIFWLYLEGSRYHSGFLRIIFTIAFACSTLSFNFGPGQIIVLHKGFILGAKIIYLILGFGSLALGLVFFKDWLLIRQGKPVNNLFEGKAVNLKLRPIYVRILTGLLAILMGALGSIWPINPYVILLGGASMLKTQWLAVSALFGTYVLFALWPFWFVWVILSFRNRRPSLFRILCSSVFFTASACVIFIFK